MSLGIVNIKASNQNIPSSTVSNLVAFNPDINRMYVLDYVAPAPYRIKYSDSFGSGWSNLSSDLTVYSNPRLLFHKGTNKLYIVSVYNNPNVIFNIQKFNAVDGSLEGMIDITAKTETQLPETVTVQNFVSDWDVCPTTGELVGIYWSYSNNTSLSWVSYVQSLFENLSIGTEFKFINQVALTFPVNASASQMQPSVCVSNTDIHVFYSLPNGFNYSLEYAYKLVSDPSTAWASNLHRLNDFANPMGPIIARCDTFNNAYFTYRSPLSGQISFSKLLPNRSESVLRNFSGSAATCDISVAENSLAMFYQSETNLYYVTGSLNTGISLMAGIVGNNVAALNAQFPRRYLSNNIQSSAIFITSSNSPARGLSIVANIAKAPVIQSLGNVNAVIGLPYHYVAGSTSDKPSLNSDVTTPVTWSTAGTVPNGFSINASTGVISWTPDATGSVSYTIRVDNVVGYDQQTVTVNVAVDNPPAISNIAPVDGSINISKNTNISFTLKDAETTVDGSSIIVKINGSDVVFTTTSVSGGYNVNVVPPTNGYIDGTTISVYVKCKDTQGHYLETTFSFSIQYTSYTLRMVKGWNFFAIPIDDSVNNQPAYVKIIGVVNSVRRLAYKISKTYLPNLVEVDFNNDPTIGIVEEIRVRDASTQIIQKWNPSLSLNEINEINGKQSYFIKIKDTVLINVDVVFTGRTWTNSDLVPTNLSLKKGENWINLIPGGYGTYDSVFIACSDIQEIQRFNKVALIMESTIKGYGGDFQSAVPVEFSSGCIVVLKNDSTGGLPY